MLGWEGAPSIPTATANHTPQPQPQTATVLSEPRQAQDPPRKVHGTRPQPSFGTCARRYLEVRAGPPQRAEQLLRLIEATALRGVRPSLIVIARRMNRGSVSCGAGRAPCGEALGGAWAALAHNPSHTRSRRWQHDADLEPRHLCGRGQQQQVAVVPLLVVQAPTFSVVCVRHQRTATVPGAALPVRPRPARGVHACMLSCTCTVTRGRIQRAGPRAARPPGTLAVRTGKS